MERLVIVGTGITGLALAYQLEDFQPQLIDKAKSPGGRMATRRTENATFDHGAQFYIGRPELSSLNSFWFEKKVAVRWYQSASGLHYRGTNGMTSLAKALAEGRRIEFNAHVDQLVRSEDSSHWVLRLKDGKQIEAETVVLTAPLPQSLLLLEQSGIEFDPELKKIEYAKALVGLFEFESDNIPEISYGGYDEPKSDGIYSICDQKAKGVSKGPAWTVVMDAAFSDKYFERDDNETLEEIEKILFTKWEVRPSSKQLKKWRYSHPLRTHSHGYALVSNTPCLLLAGDAFGGPSLHGAVRSAFATSAWLKDFFRGQNP